MYKQALKLGLKFKSNKHSGLTIADLFDYPTTALKQMANSYHALLKTPADLFSTRTGEDQSNQLRLDILLDIIQDRATEAEAKKNANADREFNAQIDALIIQKKNEELANKSVEELIAMRK